MKLKRMLAAALVVSVVSNAVFAQDNSDGKPWERQVYFGEQHLHTSASPDAFAFGTRNTADDAYRYAKGEPILNAQTGQMIQKKTPYDWCAVTDHAEYLA
jgi:hypothetical protein